MENGLKQELKRDYILLIFIFIFSLINLANTLNTNLLARQQEFGVFGKLTYHFPVLQVLLFTAALLLVQAVFSVCAVCYTRRLSIVERIKAAD